MKNLKIAGLLALGLLAAETVKTDSKVRSKNPQGRKYVTPETIKKIRANQEKRTDPVSIPKKPTNASPTENKKDTSVIMMTDKTFNQVDTEEKALDKHYKATDSRNKAYGNAYNKALKRGAPHSTALKAGSKAGAEAYDKSLTRGKLTPEQKNFLKRF